MNNDELKLKCIGRIQADPSPANLRDIAKEYELPYSRLLQWRKKYNQAIEEGAVSTLVDADQIMLHRIAEETKKDFEALVPESEASVVSTEIDGMVGRVEGIQVLNVRMQATALKLATKIDVLSHGVTDVRDLNSLVLSLSALQMAFFNKQVTNVNVQQNNYAENTVSKFKGLKKS